MREAERANREPAPGARTRRATVRPRAMSRPCSAGVRAHRLRPAARAAGGHHACACAKRGTSSVRRASSCGSEASSRCARSATRRKLVFSGDLGQYDTPILQDPFSFESADLVLMESTYGDRRHRGREDTERELGAILAQAARDGGNVIVPAFAIGRSQELLYLLAKHYAEWHLARWKIFLDSPMAIAASRVYWRHPERFDEEASPAARQLSRHAAAAQPGVVRVARRVARHQQCARRRHHHCRLRAWPTAAGSCITSSTTWRGPNATCSSSASRRRARSDGSWSIVCPEVRIHGQRVPVAAQIHTLGGLSAHGDQDDLLRWYDSFAPPPPVYLVHGEPAVLRSAGGQAARTWCQCHGRTSWLANRSGRPARAGSRTGPFPRIARQQDGAQRRRESQEHRRMNESLQQIPRALRAHRAR